MNRFGFAPSTVMDTLKACDESPDASEDTLLFVSKVLISLLPFLADASKCRFTPAILKVIQRLPPAQWPANLADTFKSALDRNEALKAVVEELDNASRAARRERAERLKSERKAEAEKARARPKSE
jgi:hypothetical protein